MHDFAKSMLELVDASYPEPQTAPAPAWCFAASCSSDEETCSRVLRWNAAATLRSEQEAAIEPLLGVRAVLPNKSHGFSS